jgi:hypothetical protein
LSDHVSASDIESGAVHGDIGARLNVLQLSEHLSALYTLAFTNEKPRDATECVGAYVDVGLGLDFAGGTNGGVQVLPGHFASLYSSDILPAFQHGNGNNRGDNDEHSDAYE